MTKLPTKHRLCDRASRTLFSYIRFRNLAAVAVVACTYYLGVRFPHGLQLLYASALVALAVIGIRLAGLISPTSRLVGSKVVRITVCILSAASILCFVAGLSAMREERREWRGRGNPVPRPVVHVTGNHDSNIDEAVRSWICFQESNIAFLEKFEGPHRTKAAGDFFAATQDGPIAKRMLPGFLNSNEEFGESLSLAKSDLELALRARERGCYIACLWRLCECQRATTYCYSFLQDEEVIADMVRQLAINGCEVPLSADRSRSVTIQGAEWGMLLDVCGDLSRRLTAYWLAGVTNVPHHVSDRRHMLAELCAYAQLHDQIAFLMELRSIDGVRVDRTGLRDWLPSLVCSELRSTRERIGRSLVSGELPAIAKNDLRAELNALEQEIKSNRSQASAYINSFPILFGARAMELFVQPGSSPADAARALELVEEAETGIEELRKLGADAVLCEYALQMSDIYRSSSAERTHLRRPTVTYTTERIARIENSRGQDDAFLVDVTRDGERSYGEWLECEMMLPSGERRVQVLPEPYFGEGPQGFASGAADAVRIRLLGTERWGPWMRVARRQSDMPVCFVGTDLPLPRENYCFEAASAELAIRIAQRMRHELQLCPPVVGVEQRVVTLAIRGTSGLLKTDTTRIGNPTAKPVKYWHKGWKSGGASEYRLSVTDSTGERVVDAKAVRRWVGASDGEYEYPLTIRPESVTEICEEARFDWSPIAKHSLLYPWDRYKIPYSWGDESEPHHNRFEVRLECPEGYVLDEKRSGTFAITRVDMLAPGIPDQDSAQYKSAVRFKNAGQGRFDLSDTSAGYMGKELRVVLRRQGTPAWMVTLPVAAILCLTTVYGLQVAGRLRAQRIPAPYLRLIKFLWSDFSWKEVYLDLKPCRVPEGGVVVTPLLSLGLVCAFWLILLWKTDCPHDALVFASAPVLTLVFLSASLFLVGIAGAVGHQLLFLHRLIYRGAG